MNLFDQISHCGHFILLVPKDKTTSNALINQSFKDDNNKLQKFIYSSEAEAAAAQKKQSPSSSASTDSQPKLKLFRYLSNVIPHLITKDKFKEMIQCDTLYHQTFINSDIKTGKFVCFLNKNEKKLKFEDEEETKNKKIKKKRNI